MKASTHSSRHNSPPVGRGIDPRPLGIITKSVHRKNHNPQPISKVEFSRNAINGNFVMNIHSRRGEEDWKYVCFEFPDNDAYAIRDGLTAALEKLEEAIPQ